MKVGLLTLEQKNEIIGQLYADDSYFNPIEDLNNDWVISTEEMEQCINPNFLWVKELPLIDYEQKPSPPFPPIA
jgi:hypothetical protein